MQLFPSSNSAVPNHLLCCLPLAGKSLQRALNTTRFPAAIATTLLCCIGLTPVVDAQPPLPAGEPANVGDSQVVVDSQLNADTKVMAEIKWPDHNQQLMPPSNLDLSETNPLPQKHLSRLNSARRQVNQPTGSPALQPAENDPTFLALFQAGGDPAEIAESRLSDLLKKLRQSRQLRDGGASQSGAANSPIGAANGADAAVDPTTSSIDETFVDPVDMQESVNEIRERIRMIRRWRDQMSASTGSENQQGIKPPVMESGPLGNPGDEQRAQLRRSISNPQGPGGSDPAIEMPDGKQGQHVSATQMMDGPVDHLALGESLYQTGNYETALLSLSQLDSRQLPPEDATWVGFMVAMCHYRTGSTDKAESLLREIVNTKSGDPMLATARWWLEHVQETGDAKKRMQQATVLMEQLNQPATNAN